VLTTIGNIHHSILPKLGQIGYLIMKYDRWGKPEYYMGLRRKYYVSSFPLCDNVWPYSLGIHTANFTTLDNRQTVKISGFYFEPID
jgi:hypothetical protein